MAQMTLRILVLSTIVFAPAMVGAQPAAQESAASRAEASSQWDEAIRLHRADLAADPHRSDLWVRIADIEARRGNLSASLDALEHAVAVSSDASLYARLSQAYASGGFGRPALHAIDGALALKPGHPEYLRARATLTTWVGDYRGAQDSYRQLEVLYPGDLEIALAFARVSAWAGDTDQAVKQYKRFLRTHGAGRPAVWLELAKAESWRGNYAGAIDALEAYRARAGETAGYQAEMAAVFANGGQPARAEDLLTRLLAESPDDYQLNLSHTIALARQHRAREAFESLDKVRKLSPDGRETRTAERVLRTLLSSSAESPFTVYADSDDLSVQRIAPRAVVALSTSTQFSAGYERSRLDARPGSGLDRLDGSSITQYEHAWAGAAQRLGRVTVNGQAGHATGAEHASTTYGIGLDARLADNVRLTFSRASAPFVVSPRTVDLGLTATSQRAQIEWTSLRYQLLVDGSFQDLSDGNRRSELTVSPRWTVARRAQLNLDLGATAYRLETTRDLDHGYYDPRRYEYYAATIYPYFKVRENVGLAIAGAIGLQRDNISPSFHFGGNLSGEATFGIYRAWVLKVNSSATLNGRLDSGAFRGFGAGAALVRRF
jgi:tetratricopeptide (TPR) repeat protein